MKIKKMTASFGTLNGRTLELSDGLNILYAPNESGKSTWCAFLRAMLYGIATNEREKQGVKPDKIKYAPWSGTPMSGSMDITGPQGDITLHRWTEKANAPMQTFSATLTGTDTPVPGMTAAGIGEKLTGVTRDVFERSAFIRQSGLSVTNSAELERRIQSLVSTGEEDVSFSETDKLLHTWLRRRKNGKKGALPELEEQMADTRRRMDEIQQMLGRSNRLEAELQECLAEKDRAVKRMEQARAEQRRVALKNMAQAREHTQAVQAETERARAELAVTDSGLKSSIFAGKTPDEAAGAVQNANRQAAEFAAAVPALSAPWLPLPFLGVFLALAIAGLVIPSLICLLVSLLPAALGVILFLRGRAARGIAAEAKEKQRAVYETFGAADREELESLLRDYTALWDRQQRAQKEASACAERLELAQKQQKETEQKLINGLDFSSGDSPAAQAGREVAELEKRLASLREQKAGLEGEMHTLGDMTLCASELSAQQDRREELARQCDALELAISALTEADNIMQQRLSPLLARRAAELFTLLTDGRYDEVTISRDLDARARLSGDTVGHETDYLSAGTKDMLYLALRLAICEVLLDSEDPCPLILDDALVELDSERMARALNLLRLMAEKRQILLFTCHEREIQYFNDDPAVTVIPVGNAKQ